MNECILVVEDCAPARELLRLCLSCAGYEVAEAASGAAALRQIRGREPDLILLDVGLPGLSGWDVLQILRHSADHSGIPVVMLTGQQDDASIAYGWQNGCACYLTKPFDLPDLLLVVRRLLKTPSPETAVVQTG